MSDEDSVRVARIYAQMAIKWDKFPPDDTVNPSVFKKVFHTTKKINLLKKYIYVNEIFKKCASWMFEIFGKEIPLFEGFICKYSRETNVKGKKRDGSLLVHVDGGPHSDDFCAVVYTAHDGEYIFC